jgi:hypothetical protein
MKRNVLLLFVLVSLSGYAQTTINNFKYVLVPEKFDFLKEVNQYNLNNRAKSHLENKGFTVYFDNTQIPKELAADKCSALKAEVTVRKTMFVTNLTLILKDCQGNIVFKSKEGKSREKEWAASYDEALAEAFKSLNEVPYAYTGPASMPAPQRVVDTVAVAPAQPVATVAAVKDAAGTLYAQATANGYQLIDTTPKIVLTLLRSSVPDYFIAVKGDVHGIVLKKSGEWFFEYYSDSKLMAEKLLIKF